MRKIPVLWLRNSLPLSQGLKCFISGMVVRGLTIMTEKWTCILKMIEFISVTFFRLSLWQFFIQINCLLFTKIYKKPAGKFLLSLQFLASGARVYIIWFPSGSTLRWPSRHVGLLFHTCIILKKKFNSTI